MTRATDMKFGVVIPAWDFSLKLMYQIDIVGGLDVLMMDNTSVLNQGGRRWCEDFGKNETEIASSKYCEFEDYFRRDIASSLSIGVDNIEVLFIKPMGQDGIIITSRFMPPQSLFSNGSTLWIEERYKHLLSFVSSIETVLITIPEILT